MDSPVRQKEGALSTRAHMRREPVADEVTVGLSVAIFAMRADEPMVAVLPAAGPVAGRGVPGDATLPGGRFSPREHGSLEAGLRSWVHQQTGLELAAARQLCTLGEGRNPAHAVPMPAVVSVCYLALLGPVHCNGRGRAGWQSWYDYLPWEDWRHGRPAYLTNRIEPRLKAWAEQQPDRSGTQASLDRRQRARLYFGCDGGVWDEEKVLERYELLCEAGLAGEAQEPPGEPAGVRPPRLRHPLQGDQTRVLARAVGEIRRAIKVQPLIFELMPEVFTLFELQKAVEAILGPHLHKQNFRRLVEGGGLVEPTGDYRFRTGGRPAQLYRFRRGVLMERLAPGVRVKAGRA